MVLKEAVIPSFSKLSINGKTILSKAGETNRISNSKSRSLESFSLPFSNFQPASLSSFVAFCNSLLMKPDPSVCGLIYSLLKTSFGC